jgi:predicted nucleic acid-binding protein
MALVYAQNYHELRSRGRVLSLVDMILASMSRSLDATLLTDDRDFDALPDLHAKNWLSENRGWRLEGGFNLR